MEDCSQTKNTLEALSDALRQAVVKTNRSVVRVNARRHFFEQSLLARRGYRHGGPYDQTHGGHHCHLTERTNRRGAFAGDKARRPAFGRPTKITAADCMQIFCSGREVAVGKYAMDLALLT
jgi:hypothetical protein